MSAAGFVAPADRLVTLPDTEPKYTLGYAAIHWAVRWLTQPNGPDAGKRWRPVPSQVAFLLQWYALDEHGNWVYDEAVRRLAKGSGKSPFAAVLALIELCAPVRFDHFDPDAPGGVVGKPVSMPLVQIAATTEAQTENTMRMIRAFCAKGSKLATEYGITPAQQVYHKAGGGKLHILTGSPRSAEGGEATFIVGDEGEHWLPNNSGPKFYSTLADNLAKSGSRMVHTMNAWEPGIESVAESLWDAWVAQEEGRASDTSILYDARVAPHDISERWDDEEALDAALEHVYGDCYWANRHAIKKRIKNPASLPSESLRKYMNQPTAAEDAWVTPQEWAQLSAVSQDGTVSRPLVDGEDVVLFFDGSKSDDATAIVGCCMSDGHLFTVGVWEVKPGEEVAVGKVDLALAQAFERFRVVAFFADVREWESFVKSAWREAYEDQLIVWAKPTGKEPQPIAWDMRNGEHARTFVTAVEMMTAEIYDKAFTHDGNPVLARHIANARRRPYQRFGMSIGKEGKDSRRKIDAAVCAVGARMVRRIVLADKDYQKHLKRRNRGPAKAIVYTG